eukprot:15184677-Alexandrium_andersonii.AAC.1
MHASRAGRARIAHCTSTPWQKQAPQDQQGRKASQAMQVDQARQASQVPPVCDIHALSSKLPFSCA